MKNASMNTVPGLFEPVMFELVYKSLDVSDMFLLLKMDNPNTN